MLLEFMNYYIQETMQEAKTYRDYSKQRNQVDVQDVRLAIASKTCDTFARPLPYSTVK